MADQNAVDATDTEAPDFLSMPDEDMKNFDPSTMASAPAAEDSAAVDGADKGDHDQDDGQPEAKVADVAVDSKAEDDKKAGDESEADTQDDVDNGAAAAKGGADQKAAGKDGQAADAKANAGKEQVEDKTVDGKAKAGDAGAEAGSGAIDYKAAYEKLTGTFKANGREIQVKNVDDAISLMQMGANYNKKMAGLKPNLRFLKMLEANGLLDEEKLGFLIDVSKRDPGAINKLIVDSQMDPLDLSADKASEYKPGNHKVDEREVELDEVIDELKGSAHYNRTLEVVATQWDPKSKSVIATTPQILKVINGHMESGIYDLIAAEMESERTFGRLKGVSDLDAYKQVGDAINARGGFNHLNLGSSQVQAKPAAVAVVVPPKPNPADEDKLKEQKRAASGTKTVATGKTLPADFNVLGMSDEDFAKFK